MNSIVKTPLANRVFRWGNNSMIYGSFLLPVIFYATNAYPIFGIKVEYGDFG